MYYLHWFRLILYLHWVQQDVNWSKNWATVNFIIISRVKVVIVFKIILVGCVFWIYLLFLLMTKIKHE